MAPLRGSGLSRRQPGHQRRPPGAVALQELSLTEVGAEKLPHQLATAQVVQCLWLIDLELQRPPVTGFAFGVASEFIKRAAQVHPGPNMVSLQR